MHSQSSCFPKPAHAAAHRPEPRIGVTTRLLTQPGRTDTHDGLSQDWGRFLAAVGVAWLPLPNRGEETALLARHLGLTGFIFTGGGDAGQEPARDATEATLYRWAMAQGLPVLGVCRGFQALHRLCGGALLPVAGHVAVRHGLTQEAGNTVSTQTYHPRNRIVNSFHNMGIATPAPGWAVLARSPDGHVEAATAPHCLGLMWHPEREPIPHMADVQLVRAFLVGAV